MERENDYQNDCDVNSEFENKKIVKSEETVFKKNSKTFTVL